MIGIKINGEFLDLFPDTQISLKLRNPIFAEGNIIPGSYSLPFELPGGDASPKNSRIFGNQDSHSVFRPERKYAASILIDGNVFKSGTMIMEAAGRDTYKAKFRFGLGEFAEEFKNTSLRSVVDEDVALDATAYTKKVTIRYDLQNSPYEVVINGKLYSGADMPGLANAINAETESPRAAAVYTDNGTAGGSGADAEGDTIDLTPVDDPENVETEFTVDYDDDRVWDVFFNGAEWQDPIATALAGYMTATPPDNRFRIPMMYNKVYDKYSDLSESGELVYTNYNTNSAFLKNTAGGEEGFFGFQLGSPFRVANRNIFQPYVMLRHVLDKIAEHFEFSYEGDFLETDVYLNGLIFHTEKLYYKVPLMREIPFIFWYKEFNIAALVPDIQVNELFKLLQRRYNLAVYYDSDRQKVIMNKRDVILQRRDYSDITDVVTPIDPVENIQVDGVRLEATRDTDDELSKTDTFKTGTPEVSITTAVNSLGAENDLPWYNNGYTLPTVEQESCTTLRLFFYKGPTPKNNNAENEYVAASINSADGAAVYSGVNGIYERYWKEYIRFLMHRRKYNSRARLTLHVLTNLDWEHKFRIDGVNCLVNELDVTLTMRGIEEVKGSFFST
jgi:hypothetical protein